MVTNYGVLQDIHDKSERTMDLLIAADDAAEAATGKGVDAWLVNGDIADFEGDIEASQHFMHYILEQLGKTGKPIYVQPGSHESSLVYDGVLAEAQRRNSNVIDVRNELVYGVDGHHLAFVPGSETISGSGSYQCGDEGTTGQYIATEQGVVPHTVANLELLAMQQRVRRIVHYQDVRDLEAKITEPDKTIVVSHMPPKFDNVAYGVDMAYFAQHLTGKVQAREVVRELLLRDHPEAQGFDPVDFESFARTKGWSFQKDNRGSVALQDLLEATGVTKGVFGHFHESAHRAHDATCTPVPENTFVSELYWNAGHGDVGKTGVLVVDEDKVKYVNVSTETNRGN